jgi:hypothetical protein
MVVYKYQNKGLYYCLYLVIILSPTKHPLGNHSFEGDEMMKSLFLGPSAMGVFTVVSGGWDSWDPSGSTIGWLILEIFHGKPSIMDNIT